MEHLIPCHRCTMIPGNSWTFLSSQSWSFNIMVSRRADSLVLEMLYPLHEPHFFSRPCLVTSIESQTTNVKTKIPAFTKIIWRSSVKPSQVSNNSWDCAIDFHPNVMPPSINTFIRSLFISFVERKDGVLKCCIDYRSLNNFTMNLYALSLVLALINSEKRWFRPT